MAVSIRFAPGLLSGGESRRMGRDKSAAPTVAALVGGRPAPAAQLQRGVPAQRTRPTGAIRPSLRSARGSS